jgi:asparagine synthetase B (glutamine-hydrolysing)
MCGIFIYGQIVPADVERDDDAMRDLVKNATRRGPDVAAFHSVRINLSQERVLMLTFYAAVLHLRGGALPTAQPCVDAEENVLCWNGEVYKGIELTQEDNDTALMWGELRRVCQDDAENGVPNMLHRVHGPFGFIYYHAQLAWTY